MRLHTRITSACAIALFLPELRVCLRVKYNTVILIYYTISVFENLLTASLFLNKMWQTKKRTGEVVFYIIRCLVAFMKILYYKVFGCIYENYVFKTMVFLNIMIFLE
jgi:hypothetical protein